MKRIIIILTIVLCNVAHSQIKIESSGRVIVGPDYGSSFDPFNVLAMSIQGPLTSNNNAGSKLAFGDFGQQGFGNSPGGWNVFVGEYGETDSDIMWLHGKKGIRLTEHNGDRILAEFGCDESSRIVFYNGIRTGQIFISSEDGFKSNLAPISGALSRLMQLGSVTYKYIVPQEYTLTAEGRNRVANSENRYPAGNSVLARKYREDSVRMARADSIRAAGSSLYGFVTSDLRRLFPELVDTDSDGNSYVDYSGLIPVIVAALAEQQQTIQHLTEQLQECCSNNSSDDDYGSYGNGQRYNSKSTSANLCQPADADAPMLYQNAPNPFSSITTISFHIPESSTTSTLYVFSINGNLIRTIPINSIGDGSVQIDGSTFPAGMYVYTLVIDGKIIDSKRMILTD